MYWLAAWKNDTHSQFMLGWSYHRGRGVRRNIREAAKWYRRAAERGSPLAQAELAKMCESGRGVRRDIREAAVWALLASAQDSPGAFERWRRLSGALTPVEVSRVCRQALMRWPSLAWKVPVPALQSLLRTVNDALPPGLPPLKEAVLLRLWSSSKEGDGAGRLRLGS
jgi:TPR repeat protein